MLISIISGYLQFLGILAEIQRPTALFKDVLVPRLTGFFFCVCVFSNFSLLTSLPFWLPTSHLPFRVMRQNLWVMRQVYWTELLEVSFLTCLSDVAVLFTCL